MKRMTFAAIMLFILLIVPVSSSDKKKDYMEFTIINNSGFTIGSFQVSASGKDNWTGNLLTSEAIYVEEKMLIRFKPKDKSCKFDFRIVTSDDEVIVLNDANICENDNFSLEFDRKWIFTCEPKSEKK